MALRLISAARFSSLLKPKLKPAPPPPSRSYLLSRPRLVPLIDEVPTVFSIKALKHHWGVIPILAICGIGLILKVVVIILLGTKKDDVWFTKDSARCENFETRSGPWYKVKSLKWGGRDDYPVPPGAILARQGCVDGPSFSEDKDVDGGISVSVVAAHIAVSALIITVAFLL